MVRGARRWTARLAAVLGVVAVVMVGAAPAPSAESPSYKVRVDAVAYSLPGRTAIGTPVARGVVAVDPKLIPLGSRLFVPGYGRGIAADVGTAIKGRIIDVWFPTLEQARAWGRRSVVITVYR